MGIFGLILGLAVLSILIYKRVPVTYAALAASLFHYRELEIRDVKQYLRDRGVSVRLD